MATHLLVLVVAQFGLPGTCTRPEVAAHFIPIELVPLEQVEELFAPPPPPAGDRFLADIEQTAPVARDGLADEPIEPAVIDPPDEPQDVVTRDPPLEDPAPPRPNDVVVLPDEVVDQPDVDPDDVLALINSIAGGAEPDPTDIIDTMQSAAITPEDLNEIETLKQSIIAQVSRCWSPPTGVPGADKLLVEVHVRFETDGRLAGIAVFDGDRMRQDPTFRAAGEAAKRAFMNPRCNPLQLPIDKYALWKEIIFTFNPSEMVN